MEINDIATLMDDNGLWDYAIESGGLSVDSSLNSAITYLLFTNAFDNTYPVGHKEGWAGGTLTCFLWQYKHSILNDETILEIEGVIQDALQPLIDNNIVSEIDVSGAIDDLATGATIFTIEYTQVRSGEIGKYYFAYQQIGA